MKTLSKISKDKKKHKREIKYCIDCIAYGDIVTENQF